MRRLPLAATENMKIKEIKIYTKNLEKQIDFYSNSIGLKLIDSSISHAVFSIGKSKMRIEQSENFQPYHFAINIPCNKENEALEWLKQRVKILKDDTNEIQDFDFWNAKEIYFYDTDKNIVEFIARKNMKNESREVFGVHSLLQISEIGVPVNNIEYTYSTLKKITGVPIFDGGFERFCAIGDENGLFICINKFLKDWFPTGDKPHSSEFEIKVVENDILHELEFKNGQINEI